MFFKLKHIILFLFIGQVASAQCAMCKAVVESGDSTLAQGINNGILYLMAMPYLLVIVAGILFFRYYLKKKI